MRLAVVIAQPTLGAPQLFGQMFGGRIERHIMIARGGMAVEDDATADMQRNLGAHQMRLAREHRMRLDRRAEILAEKAIECRLDMLPQRIADLDLLARDRHLHGGNPLTLLADLLATPFFFPPLVGLDPGRVAEGALKRNGHGVEFGQARDRTARSQNQHFFAAALHRGWDAHRLAVFRDGAAGDVDAFRLQQLDDPLVGQGFVRSSPSIRPRMRKRTASAECASPPREAAIDEVKKYFSSNSPRGVAMYLFVVTRLTVLSCMPIASAMSRRISGRSAARPGGKTRPAGSTISVATLRIVVARWCSDLTSQLAACSRSVRYSRSALLRAARLIRA